MAWARLDLLSPCHPCYSCFDGCCSRPAGLAAIARAILVLRDKDLFVRKLLSMLFGLSIGAAIGAILVSFFSPFTSEELRDNWRTHYRRALIAGRKASAERRDELEKELRDLRDR